MVEDDVESKITSEDTNSEGLFEEKSDDQEEKAVSHPSAVLEQVSPADLDIRKKTVSELRPSTADNNAEEATAEQEKQSRQPQVSQAELDIHKAFIGELGAAATDENVEEAMETWRANKGLKQSTQPAMPKRRPPCPPCPPSQPSQPSPPAPPGPPQRKSQWTEDTASGWWQPSQSQPREGDRDWHHRHHHHSDRDWHHASHHASSSHSQLTTTEVEASGSAHRARKRTGSHNNSHEHYGGSHNRQHRTGHHTSSPESDHHLHSRRKMDHPASSHKQRTGLQAGVTGQGVGRGGSLGCGGRSRAVWAAGEPQAGRLLRSQGRSDRGTDSVAMLTATKGRWVGVGSCKIGWGGVCPQRGSQSQPWFQQPRQQCQ